MLEEHGDIKVFNNGEILFKEGAEGNDMYVIRRGKVEIYRGNDGHEVVLATLGPGDFFGEMVFFGDKTRSASARVVEDDSEVQVVNKDTFFSFINEPIVMEILERLGQRIIDVNNKVEKLTLEDQSRKEYINKLFARNWDF
ncbi:MAG: cyclic nucleotide-binding domain-containing protein [Actinobacteria bacterium]|nr:MAG: cyclic nucleotide-binding domain-containing protein [Actinomycetota bacterium]